MYDVIAFDADDTLWHSEPLYRATEEAFCGLLAGYHDAEAAVEALHQAEMQNIRYFGYGIRMFALSMIEAAIELSGGQIPTRDIQSIIDMAKGMREAPVRLFEHVEDVLASLSQSHTLMVITKGDLIDQEDKIARSGLAGYFTHIEIVSDKTSDVYRALLAKYSIDPRRFLMVGNSLKSDILPVVAIGGHAVFIPYELTWAYEHVTIPDEEDPKQYTELEHIGLLPEHIRQTSDG
jgi:putative hydrolase of the HAD superfamily